ncbi:RAD55 family ATPase [Natrialbaceae archaeon GCM10025810]|uniref:RAD55 family ATPase n=1 Tax=Halovalidus salilacus TaxID=3075124 RepID=UPI003620CD0E
MSSQQQRPTDAPTGQRFLCDYCGYPIPNDVKEPEEDEGKFCSEACLEAGEEGESMPEPEAYKRVVTGVEPLDSLVRNGLPTDAFVLLSGEEGTRREELLAELAWRALERGEPAVVVSYTNPPTATLERFFENGWNVLPALENDRLRVLDCFTSRLDDPDAYGEAENEWKEFVGEAAGDALVNVDDSTDPGTVVSELEDALEDLEMTETGIVTIDSVDALETELEEGSLREFATTVRARVCKARYVPIVGGAMAFADERGRGIEPRSAIGRRPFEVDGIVDLRLADHLAPETRLRQMSVRKLVGAQFSPQWTTYDHAPGRGLYTFEPSTERRPEGRLLGSETG